MEVMILKLSLCFCAFFGCVSTEKITTSLGEIEGWSGTSRNGTEYLAWTNIKYATAERFQAPWLVSSWEQHPYNATGTSPQCLQFETLGTGPMSGEEDCLLMNIYRPKVITGKLPVLVYVHGGGFLSGGLRSQNSAEYFMDHQVVLVGFQYRLGIFGFLSDETEEMSGNWGLKDQAAALMWVNKHIADFGGDPSKVTIFGESAGAASVRYLLVANSTRSLVSGGIISSGSVTRLIESGLAKATFSAIVGRLGCEKETAITCLKSKNAQELLTVSRGIGFRPLVEIEHNASFMSSNPLKVDFKTPIIVSWTEGEYKLFIAKMRAAGQPTLEEINENLSQYVANVTSKAYNSSEVESIIKKYFPGRVVATIEQMAKMRVDMTYTYPGMDILDTHLGPKFAYHLEYLAETSFATVLNVSTTVAVHADDLYSWFRTEEHPNLNERDALVSKKFVKFVVDFATHSNPSSEDLQWTEYTSAAPVFLRIKADGSFAETSSPSFIQPLIEVRDFWRDIFTSQS